MAIINNRFIRSLIKNNYKKIGGISLLVGAVYAARAFLLMRAPGELPLSNAYTLIIGVLLCLCAIGVYFCAPPYSAPLAAAKTGGLHHPRQYSLGSAEGSLGVPYFTLLCFIIFTLTFEKAGTIEASFIFSFILGVIWNRSASENNAHNSFAAYLSASKRKMAVNILAACVSAAGIWLVFERIFSLSLP